MDCAEEFTSYFNTRFASDYTAVQVDSIYMADIGSTPTACAPLFCDTCGTPVNSLTGPLLCGKSEPVFPAMIPEVISSCTDSTFFTVSKGTTYYEVFRDSLKNNFDSSYIARCLEAQHRESFTVSRPYSEYHYTLYYYDQAGNLVKTVPPAGVDERKFRWAVAWSDSVRLARHADQSLIPDHRLATRYRYNTLNQVIAQQTPDAGGSRFWYDRLGRLALSQNAKQRAASTSEEQRRYSYTLYDVLGRITEVGELANATSDTLTDSLTRIPASLQSWLTASQANKSQITHTVYDWPYAGFTGISPVPLVQRHLRNRVSYSSFTQGANPAQYNQATFYSYDIQGNVDTLLQDYGRSEETATRNIMNTNNNRFKKLVYTYDLISGKVNTVAYQSGHPDRFYHRYRYDAENRLTEVSTSSDSVHWQKDARYEYYKHGPLARMVLGDQQVQGVDYAYTLQGWLKGVNSTALHPEQDMASDGLNSNQYQYVARDAVGFSLHYYDGDYQPIGDNVNPFPALNGDHLQGSYRPLYNGNISSMAVSIGQFGPLPLLYNYKYDRLNRLTQLDTWKGYNASGNNWSGVLPTDDYKERIAYDGNGNILRYLRNTANQSQPMDSLRYAYYAGTNRLSHVVDGAPAWIEGIKDIETQPADNYSYDSIGNLTGDISENIPEDGIEWNVYGKIASITRSSAVSGNDTRQIRYRYDASGNRIGKKVTKFGSAEVAYTWYSRDASGNVMAIYTAKKDTTSSTALSEFDLSLSEQEVYGSSRLGVQQVSEGVEGNLPTVAVYQHWLGRRRYELSNHLGNVLTTISDRKIDVADATDGSLTDHYLADVVSAEDYYPFGMLMPDRTFNASGYKYGFNGKENDNEVKGEGNQINYGTRIYDTRIGKFLSVDPLQAEYPMLTPYQYAGNNPISGIDLDGLEFKYYSLKNTPNADFRSHLQIDKKLAVVDRTIKTRVKANWYSYPTIIMPGTSLTSPVLGSSDEWNLSFNTKMSDIHLTTTVVSPDGKTWRVLPDYFDLLDLPPLNDEVWSSLPTPDEYLSTLIEKGNALAVKGTSYAQAINMVSIGLSMTKPLRYKLGKNDVDLRGTGKNFNEALDEAFLNTGVKKEKFEVTKWGKNKYGKSVPVEYRAKGGAEVSIDYGHSTYGPDAPHIGWQTKGKKEQKSGHIILDDVPAGRSDKKN